MAADKKDRSKSELASYEEKLSKKMGVIILKELKNKVDMKNYKDGYQKEGHYMLK